MQKHYPPTVYYLKNRDGSQCGEWRGGSGRHSVFAGEHPDSTDENVIRYTLQGDKPVVQIAFKDIVWPANMELPWRDKTRHHRTGFQPKDALDKDATEQTLPKPFS